MIYGAILAGGLGRRMERAGAPKQFLELGHVPVLVYTLRKFLEVTRFTLIYIAVHADWMEQTEGLLSQHFTEEERGRLRLVQGGGSRLDSFLGIMEEIVAHRDGKNEDILICHDSVRPFVRRSMIEDCIDAALAGEVAQTAVPAEDTVFLSHSPGYLDETLDRSLLFKGQTPTGFRIGALREVCRSVTGAERERCTGTTQLMLRAGRRLKIVEGHTSNFKITTDNDLDVADRMVRADKPVRKAGLLDCTLRDGGIVIDFEFGAEKMQEIRRTLEDAGVTMIECGYLDEKKGGGEGRTCYDSEKAIAEGILGEGKRPGVTYLAMIDYGTFSPDRLGIRDGRGVDAVRLAFHKENWQDAVDWGRKILDKGYQLYMQPMVSVRYSDEEYCGLIRTINRELPEAKGFYIVDSFGQMNDLDVIHKMELADRLVSPDMIIGLHAHNHRQLAYSNALAFLNYPAKHDVMVDSSIMGMGKGPGNCCTELLMVSMIQKGLHYSANGIYRMIAEYFAPLKEKKPWGYCLEYYFSAVFGCTPSYVKIFLADSRVDTDALVNLLKNMPEYKKISCDRAFAAEYLESYFH